MRVKRLFVMLLCVALTATLSGCGCSNEALTSEDVAAIVPDFASMDDPALLRYMEDNIFTNLELDLGEDYHVENVAAVYLPVAADGGQGYQLNSQDNAFFGYTLPELDKQYTGTRYVFSMGDDGKTGSAEYQSYDNAYVQAFDKVATGDGVIVCCITVSNRTDGAPVNAMCLAAADVATDVAMSEGVMSRAVVGAIKAYEGGSSMKVIAREAGLRGSAGFRWAAVIGQLGKNVEEGVALRNTAKALETADDGVATLPKYVPSPHESLLAALAKFEGRQGVAYLNGREVDYDTPGATHPDIVRDVNGMDEAIVLKNYDLVNNANGLYFELKREVEARAENLPVGTLQRVVLDVRGREYDDTILETVEAGIWANLNHVYTNIPIEIIVS